MIFHRFFFLIIFCFTKIHIVLLPVFKRRQPARIPIHHHHQLTTAIQFQILRLILGLNFRLTVVGRVLRMTFTTDRYVLVRTADYFKLKIHEITVNYSYTGLGYTGICTSYRTEKFSPPQKHLTVCFVHGLVFGYTGFLTYRTENLSPNPTSPV